MKQDHAGTRAESFPPSADPAAVILILGSMPGEASLAAQEYYAFPHNAFWPVMCGLFHFERALPYPARLEILRRNGIALWDVLKSCERATSLDSDIRSPEPNDISGLVKQLPRLRKILCNGGKAADCLKRYFPELVPMSVRMPSTSPAAAGFPFEQKYSIWKKELEPCWNRPRE